MEYMLWETEQTHCKVRRYTSPDEHPFFPHDLPPLVLPPMKYPEASLDSPLTLLTLTPPYNQTVARSPIV